MIPLASTDFGRTRPLALEHERLVGAGRRPEALQQHRLDAVERRAGLQTRLLVEGEVDVAGPVEAALFAIAQEALNNALKHAATSVTVRIRAAADWVELEVADDGRGFEPAHLGDQGGLGLTSMRERAERLGGSVAVISSPGIGTRVVVRLDGTVFD